MAGVGVGSGISQLGLTPEEQRVFKQIFNAANPDGIEVVTGDVALRFFPDRTKLPSEVLGEIWQVADTEDTGFITEEGFYILLRLIGYAQAGRPIDGGLARKPGGPMPRLDGINAGGVSAAPLLAQSSGGPIKVPPLSPENAQRYASLFDQSGAQSGMLDGGTAKSIFDRSQLPNDILVRIWNLADTESRGHLSITEFIIAMHLIASYRSGNMRALPRNLPAGLYEAAARRGASSRPTSGSAPSAAIPRQFSGPATPRTSSPLAGRTPQALQQVSAQTTGNWAVAAQEKAQYDAQFAKLDIQNSGFLSGEQAATFFGNSRLPEDDLAQIWDLADMRSEGQLNRDEFAVAMHLIRNQLSRRGPIPKTLPANLIPPNVRQAQSAPAAALASSPKPKSAADDLFGLDALADTAPAPVPAPAPIAQIPQSTGDSSAAPVRTSSPALSSQSTQPTQSTFFKPFVPTSSFGQAVVSPQPTGASSSSQPQQPSLARSMPTNDDLLGDTDPEISKRLTNETTELANLSNQVGNLANQMQEVKNKNSAVDTNMATVSKQKQEFELRLGQLRTAYEQEARDLRTKEDRLATVQNECKKLSADLAMVQHSFTNLQEKRQQVEQAIEAQQQEIAGYKEQLRGINAQVAQVKPELEKAESALRQQKGLNAITKKQVSTAEAEYERLREQMDGLTRDNEEAIKEAKELDESQRSLQSRQATTSPPAASPTPSSPSQNTNPFFRRQTTSSSVNLARSPTGQETVQTPNHSAFDSFFNTAFPPAEGSSAPPLTSFGGAPSTTEETVATDPPSTSGTDKAPVTPTHSETKLPPPPPQSRQITSSALPLNNKNLMPASPASSTSVVPPVSRFGEGSGQTTPAEERPPTGTDDPSLMLSPLSQTHASQETREGVDSSQSIPGSFPGDSTPPDALAGEPVSKEGDGSFGMSGLSRSGTSKDDFDSAFAGFEDKGKGLATDDAFAPAPSTKEEFPPIQEFDDDDDSDSDSSDGRGFDDNFTSPGRAAAAAAKAPAEPEARPEASRSTSHSEQLPGVSAQQSPPTYDQTMSPNGKTRSGSNQFPAQYGDLLPSREPPTSPGGDAESPVQQTSARIGSMSANDPPVAAAAVPAAKPSSAFDEFDNEFGELSESRLSEDRADDDPTASSHGEFGDEFNPTFDSPAASKMTASSAFGTASGGFEDFEVNVSAPTQASAASAGAPAAGAGADHDWDAMFADLGKDGGAPQTNGSASAAAADADDIFGTAAGGSAAGGLQPPAKPVLSRGLSEGTEHDDPILKRLTAMGYPRGESLAALEKFDYNLDKAADFLTQQ